MSQHSHVRFAPFIFRSGPFANIIAVIVVVSGCRPGDVIGNPRSTEKLENPEKVKLLFMGEVAY